MDGRAIDVYDGPSFRMVRKEAVDGLYVLILSAKYGLITQDERISCYDQFMNPSRALALQEETAQRLRNHLEENNFKEIYINVGKTYTIAIDGAKEILCQHPVRWGSGEIGERLHQMKLWLQSLEGEGKS